MEETEQTDTSPSPDIGTLPGHLLCWGSGKQGQHGHILSSSGQELVPFHEASLSTFSPDYKDTAVKLMSCGSSHTVVVTEDNDIYVWGSGHCGQLGLGDEETRPAPVKVELYALQRESPDIMGVACGSRHTVVWLNNGKAFSFGNNTFAQLAYDSKIKNYRANQTRPHLLRILANRTVVQAACGEKHTVFLYMGGQCAVVGSGSLGQTGSTDRLEAILPRTIRGIPPIKCVAAGAYHCVVIDVTGEVWQWGQALACGKTGEEGDVLKPERCVTNHPNIVQVEGGHTHSVALSANGSVYTWGYGPDGQLGLGDGITLVSVPTKLQCAGLRTNVCRVGCGDNYTAALTGSGLLYIWGKNSYVINPAESSSWLTSSPRLINSEDCAVDMLACGGWHMVARTGTPGEWRALVVLLEDWWQKEDDRSDTEEEPSIASTMSVKEEDLRREVSLGIQRDSRMAMSRERTTISLADFYAPSPEPQTTGRALSPDILHGHKKLPSISDQGNMINQHGAKQPKYWRGAAGSPQKPIEPLSPLDTIQQSPRSMKTDSTPRKSLPRYVAPERTLDHQSVSESKQTYEETPSSTMVQGRSMDYKSTIFSNRSVKSESESQKIHGQKQMNQSHDAISQITGASVIDLNEMNKSESDNDKGSVESFKTQKTHKSRSEILQARLAVQGQPHTLEDKTPQSNYVHSQITRITHPDRRKKYSLGSPQKTLNTKLRYVKDTPMRSVNMNPIPEKVLLNSTQMNFVYPEPLYSPQYYQKAGINRYQSRSQPESLHRDQSFFSPHGFRGKGFYRNASKQSDYSLASPYAHGSPLSPTNRNTTNAACVAYQRSVAKEKVDRRKRMEQARFNGVLPAATNVTHQTSPTSKRSYAVPRRVSLLAKNLIHRTNNYVGESTESLPTGQMKASNRSKYSSNKNESSQVKNTSPRRVDGTIGALATEVT